MVVWKLYRLGRSLKDLIELVFSFREKGVEFVGLKDGFDRGTANGRFTFNIFASLAEFKREIIEKGQWLVWKLSEPGGEKVAVHLVCQKAH